MSSQREPVPVTQASYYDSWRVFTSVVVPTLGKGVIKRRPFIEEQAQHRSLDTKAVQLLQELRHKYGDGPLLFRFLFRSQVLVLNPHQAAQVLDETPEPYSPASKEKKSALSHLEPGNILISDPERRKELRPVHEHALATHERLHPLAGHFVDVVQGELETLLQSLGSEDELNWSKFSLAWFRIVRRITLGDSARDDEDLTRNLDDIRRRGNWGFLKFTNDDKLEVVQTA